MILVKALIVALTALTVQVQAHYTFPSLIVNGQVTPQWVNVRRTNNYNTQAPVTDVTSMDLRCYDTATDPSNTAETIQVRAGDQLGIQCDQTIYHPGVVNVYMAKAPEDIDGWAGDGSVWFKVHEIPAETNGGQSITFPAEGLSSVSFTVPSALPSGQYLVRMEAIALHVAQSYGGAQFYISCGQVEITGGGSGTPGPTVEIPGVYTGNEPGILININYPIPTNYTQPGPPVWTG